MLNEGSIHTDINRLLDILKATGKKYDTEKIKAAFEYANELHEGHNTPKEFYFFISKLRI